MNIFESSIDLTDLKCPLPLLKTKLLFSDLSSGECLNILTSDPVSWNDFQSFSKITGNKIIEKKKQNKNFYFRIQKK